MRSKKPIGIGIFVALVAMAAMAFSASSALAVFPPCENNVLCSGTAPNPKIRDDVDAAPVPPGHVAIPGGGGFGADALAVNTVGPLRFCATSALLGKKCNENPKGYAFFGLKVDLNPKSSTEKCEKATGWVEFADVQHATPSPVYSGTAPAAPAAPAVGGFGPWPLTVTSDSKACPEAERGKVTISNVTLFFPELIAGVPLSAGGTFTGKYQQPEAATCPGGGVKLDIAQPGVETNPTTGKTSIIDNGAGATNAFICFVSSNNVLFPKTAPTWEPLEGSIWKD